MITMFWFLLQVMNKVGRALMSAVISSFFALVNFNHSTQSFTSAVYAHTDIAIVEMSVYLFVCQSHSVSLYCYRL